MLTDPNLSAEDATRLAGIREFAALWREERWVKPTAFLLRLYDESQAAIASRDVELAEARAEIEKLRHGISRVNNRLALRDAELARLRAQPAADATIDIQFHLARQISDILPGTMRRLSSSQMQALRDAIAAALTAAAQAAYDKGFAEGRKIAFPQAERTPFVVDDAAAPQSAAPQDDNPKPFDSAGLRGASKEAKRDGEHVRRALGYRHDTPEQEGE